MVIPSKRSLLDEQGLKECLIQTYRFPNDLAVTFWRTGIAGNDVYLLKTPQQQYVLKIYFVRSLPAQVHASVTIMDNLARQEIPVPRIVRNASNECVTAFQCPEGVRYAVVFEHIQGREPDRLNDRDAAAIGRLVGRMYRVLDDCDTGVTCRSIDQTYLIQRALDDIQRYLPAEQEKIGYLTTMGRRLWTIFERYAAHQLPHYGLCHGDLHTGNMLKTSSGDIMLFDFDACGQGARIYDLGIYANDDWTKTTQQDLERDREALEKFLCGYTEYSPLTQDEYTLFPLMLGIRHFELFGVVLRNCVFLEGSHWVESCLQFHYDWFTKWERHIDWNI
jgi:Ser/Thr protein kinase RdoA (MazF antagonist)